MKSQNITQKKLAGTCGFGKVIRGFVVWSDRRYFWPTTRTSTSTGGCLQCLANALSRLNDNGKEQKVHNNSYFDPQ